MTEAEENIQIDAYVTPERLSAENAKLGRWLIAGTPIDDPYPCMCKGRCGDRCPCRGRTDAVAAKVPRSCCGLRITVVTTVQMTDCIDCGTPTPLKQWEIDSNSLLRRCEGCAQVWREARQK